MLVKLERTMVIDLIKTKLESYPLWRQRLYEEALDKAIVGCMTINPIKRLFRKKSLPKNRTYEEAKDYLFKHGTSNELESYTNNQPYIPLLEHFNHVGSTHENYCKRILNAAELCTEQFVKLNETDASYLI